MSQLIVTSRYLKSGLSNKPKNYVKYIATRETVEKREQNIEHNKAPASEKQQELLSSLLNDFPESKMYLAQAESESISKNVTWGKQKAYADGKVAFQYKHTRAVNNL